MQVIHCPSAGEERILADRVRLADGLLAKGRGLMGARPLEDGEGVVFRFRRSGKRRVHTLFVRAAIDVLWVANEEVVRVETVQPWSPGVVEVADTIVELREGVAEDVEPGSIVRLLTTVEMARPAHSSVDGE